MDWRELIDAVPDAEVLGSAAPNITGVAYDSRKVQPGDLFVCIEGARFDGHDYIPDAIARGAVAVVIAKSVSLPPDFPALRVANSRQALGLLAQRFYGDPTARLTLVGITGTNGKTTSTYLLKSILEAAGYKTGLTGTIETILGDKRLPATRTTAESLDFLRLMAQMVDEGITHGVAEVSSHAIALDRIVGSRYAYGLLTNISQDHLDFHQTLEHYVETKAAFFATLGRGAVINFDETHKGRFLAKCQVPVLTYGLREGAAVRATDLKTTPQGTSFMVNHRGGTFPIQIPLIGDFNVYNALGVIAVALQMFLDPQAIQRGLAQAPQVPGRFETVDLGQDFLVVVDYAHTPDGLENVLKTARSLVPTGQILCVFGCGGDRDRGKRPRMGRVAADLADYVVVTSDNPRSEDPERICAEIEGGIESGALPTQGYVRILERSSAIEHAIGRAGPGDLVLIAGKGHETQQEFKGRTIQFDDRQVAKEALRKRGYGK